MLVDAATRAFFGNSLPKLLPGINSIFDRWDMNSYMTTYQYPTLLSKAAIVPREQIIKALTQYLELPKSERSDAVPLIEELEEEQHHAGLSNEDSARIFMIIYWGCVIDHCLQPYRCSLTPRPKASTPTPRSPPSGL